MIWGSSGDNKPNASVRRAGGTGLADVSVRGATARREPEATEWFTDGQAPRTACRYGEECRNRRPKHRREFAHPGDPDYSARDPKQEEEVRKLFQKWDLDGNGTVERQEMTIL